VDLKPYPGQMSKYKNYKDELYRILWQLAFNVRVDPKTHCWEYTKEGVDNYIHIKTYKSNYFKSNSTYLHRYMYAIYHNKSLTKDNVIMHLCDNRLCINPKHLKLGTIQENNLDRDTKRSKRTKPTK
jgi:hypothetical protein